MKEAEELTEVDKEILVRLHGYLISFLKNNLMLSLFDYSKRRYNKHIELPEGEDIDSCLRTELKKFRLIAKELSGETEIFDETLLENLIFHELWSKKDREYFLSLFKSSNEITENIFDNLKR